MLLTICPKLSLAELPHAAQDHYRGLGMLFRFEIVALAIALTVSSGPAAVACESGGSSIGLLPQSVGAQAEAQVSDVGMEEGRGLAGLGITAVEAVTSENADSDALESTRFVRLDEEMFALVTASFAAPEDTTGSILLSSAGDGWVLDGWEDR
jgi:hypothetical protein